jgi:hypothetical protein
VGIIHIIAPTALLAVAIFELISATFRNFCSPSRCTAFFISGIIVALQKCGGGPALETTVERMRERLERWKKNKRLSLFPLDALQRRLDWLYQRSTRSTREDESESSSSKEQSIV